MPVNAPNYQYPEDIAHVSGDRGTVALVVRKDTGASIAGSDGDYTILQTDSLGNLRVLDSSQLVPKVYDYISITYTGEDITGVVYKTGGSGGTTVATLTLTYSGGKLATVTRT